MGSGLSKHPDEIPSSSGSAQTASSLHANASTASTLESVNKESSTTASSSSESKCPMKRADGSYSFDWGALFRPQFPHGPGGSRPISEQEARQKVTSTNDKAECPVDRRQAKPAIPTASGGGCPVKHNPKNQQQVEYNVYSQPIDPSNNMPSHANQMPAPVQSKALSTNRVASSIPKGGTEKHTTWTYPSPQMFYNALARKGKLADTDEDEIDNVVAMHNNMNEKTWSRILEWEKVCTTPSTYNRDDDTSTRHPPSKLLKFQGRPTDLSPKAMFKHYVLGHPLPYDRHDWTIVREDGTTVRYVIDYYYDESRARDTPESALPHLHDHNATPSLLVDVRPALDRPSALWNRIVTMPYAQQIAQSTKFAPLPLWPTPDMKSQVSESVQVWKRIQQQAGGKDSKESYLVQSNKLEEHQAKELAERFGRILRECSQQQQKNESVPIGARLRSC